MSRRYPNKFTIILEPEKDGGYSVHCPALPGCSSQGNSKEEVLDNIKEAIRGILKVRQKMGLSLPVETSKMLTEEIKQILLDRAKDGLPLTIETREIEIPLEVAV